MTRMGPYYWRNWIINTHDECQNNNQKYFSIIGLRNSDNGNWSVQNSCMGLPYSGLVYIYIVLVPSHENKGKRLQNYFQSFWLHHFPGKPDGRFIGNTVKSNYIFLLMDHAGPLRPLSQYIYRQIYII